MREFECVPSAEWRRHRFFYCRRHSAEGTRAFSSPLLIRKPLSCIHNLIYLIFQLSELFGHFGSHTSVVVTYRLRFPINPDRGESFLVITPDSIAHSGIPPVLIFQREEVHSVKLRH